MVTLPGCDKHDFLTTQDIALFRRPPSRLIHINGMKSARPRIAVNQTEDSNVTKNNLSKSGPHVGSSSLHQASCITGAGRGRCGKDLKAMTDYTAGQKSI